MSEEFVGAGLAFPLRTDATDQILLVTPDRHIAASIRLVLGTALGPGQMRPECRRPLHAAAPRPVPRAGVATRPPVLPLPVGPLVLRRLVGRPLLSHQLPAVACPAVQRPWLLPRL